MEWWVMCRRKSPAADQSGWFCRKEQFAGSGGHWPHREVTVEIGKYFIAYWWYGRSLAGIELLLVFTAGMPICRHGYDSESNHESTQNRKRFA